MTWDILDLITVLDIWYPTCVPNFSILAWLEVCQEHPVLDGGTWRTLMVPDRRLGGQSHRWHHGSSWGTPRKIPWKFCIIIFIFGWDMRVCYDGNKNITNKPTTNKQTDTSQIYIRKEVNIRRVDTMKLISPSIRTSPIYLIRPIFISVNPNYPRRKCAKMSFKNSKQ